MAKPTKNQTSQALTQQQLAEMLIVQPTRRRREPRRYRSLGRALLVLAALAVLVAGAWGVLRGLGAG